MPTWKYFRSNLLIGANQEQAQNTKMQMFCVNVKNLFDIEIIYEIILLRKMQTIETLLRDRQSFDSAVSKAVEGRTNIQQKG